MRSSAWLMIIFLGSCQFERPDDVPAPVDAAIDSPDAAPPECTAGSRTCAADKYTECDAGGRFVRYDVPNAGPDGAATTLVMHDYACPLGCHATEPRCLDVLPTNGVERAIDTGQVSPTGIDVVIDDPSGEAQILDDQAAGSTSVTIALASGATVAVPARIWPQPGGPDLRILEVRSFTIRAGSRLKLRGVKPIAIASHFDIYIAGVLDYSGSNNFPSMVQAGCDVPIVFPAGAGPGNAAAGGASSNGQAGGAALTGNPDLVPLTGGCTAGLGMGGGGLQLVSRTRIAVAPAGVITVAGRRGQALTAAGSPFHMAGGGAGGNVVLEAPGVGLIAGAVVIGRGGSGAAGNSTTRSGADGLAGDADPTGSTVTGATCPDCASRGGAGGTEASAAGTAGTGSGNALAGGGGSVGRAIIRTRTIAFPPAGVMKIVSQPRQLSTR